MASDAAIHGVDDKSPTEFVADGELAHVEPGHDAAGFPENTGLGPLHPMQLQAHVTGDAAGRDPVEIQGLTQVFVGTWSSTREETFQTSLVNEKGDSIDQQQHFKDGIGQKSPAILVVTVQSLGSKLPGPVMHMITPHKLGGCGSTSGLFVGTPFPGLGRSLSAVDRLRESTSKSMPGADDLSNATLKENLHSNLSPESSKISTPARLDMVSKPKALSSSETAHEEQATPGDCQSDARDLAVTVVFPTIMESENLSEHPRFCLSPTTIEGLARKLESLSLQVSGPFSMEPFSEGPSSLLGPGGNLPPTVEVPGTCQMENPPTSIISQPGHSNEKHFEHSSLYYAAPSQGPSPLQSPMTGTPLSAKMDIREAGQTPHAAPSPAVLSPTATGGAKHAGSVIIATPLQSSKSLDALRTRKLITFMARTSSRDSKHYLGTPFPGSGTSLAASDVSSWGTTVWNIAKDIESSQLEQRSIHDIMRTETTARHPLLTNEMIYAQIMGACDEEDGHPSLLDMSSPADKCAVASPKAHSNGMNGQDVGKVNGGGDEANVLSSGEAQSACGAASQDGDFSGDSGDRFASFAGEIISTSPLVSSLLMKDASSAFTTMANPSATSMICPLSKGMEPGGEVPGGSAVNTNISSVFGTGRVEGHAEAYGCKKDNSCTQLIQCAEGGMTCTDSSYTPADYRVAIQGKASGGEEGTDSPDNVAIGQGSSVCVDSGAGLFVGPEILTGSKEEIVDTSFDEEVPLIHSEKSKAVTSVDFAHEDEVKVCTMGAGIDTLNQPSPSGHHGEDASSTLEMTPPEGTEHCVSEVSETADISDTLPKTGDVLCSVEELEEVVQPPLAETTACMMGLKKGGQASKGVGAAVISQGSQRSTWQKRYAKDAPRRTSSSSAAPKVTAPGSNDLGKGQDKMMPKDSGGLSCRTGGNVSRKASVAPRNSGEAHCQSGASYVTVTKKSTQSTHGAARKATSSRPASNMTVTSQCPDKPAVLTSRRGLTSRDSSSNNAVHSALGRRMDKMDSSTCVVKTRPAAPGKDRLQHVPPARKAATISAKSSSDHKAGTRNQDKSASRGSTISSEAAGGHAAAGEASDLSGRLPANADASTLNPSPAPASKENESSMAEEPKIEKKTAQCSGTLKARSVGARTSKPFKTSATKTGGFKIRKDHVVTSQPKHPWR